MQLKNWNDLRYLLALKRGRSISAAAQLMGVDDTTVSRRLAALQAASDVELYVRQASGSFALTPQGKEIAARIEAMEHETDLIAESLGSDRHACGGTVRLTSVPILINRVLAPAVEDLIGQHPQLVIELIPDSRDYSLTLREADIALRLARPTAGGTKVKARRIGRLDFAIYASRGYSAREGGRLPWISYEDAMAHLHQAQWMARAARANDEAISGLRVHDVETALEAVVAGQGKSLLPTIVADSITCLRRLRYSTAHPLPSREIWRLVHEDQRLLRKTEVVVQWIEHCIARRARGGRPFT